MLSGKIDTSMTKSSERKNIYVDLQISGRIAGFGSAVVIPHSLPVEALRLSDRAYCGRGELDKNGRRRHCSRPSFFAPSR